MKQIRNRLTYANVMSSIALFLVLGGGAAFAAGQLGKNTVGSKQLKKNAVTTAKIKKNAVTGAKIKNGTITGNKLNLGSVGTVPSASNAANAAHAAEADATNGQHLGRFSFIADANTAKTQIFSANGLTLFAECNGSGDLDFTATTSVENSEIFESGNFNATYEGAFDNSFDPGETEKVGENIGDNSQEEVQGQLVYYTPTGAVVTAQFGLEDSGVFGDKECAAIGTVQYS